MVEGAQQNLEAPQYPFFIKQMTLAKIVISTEMTFKASGTFETPKNHKNP